MSLSEDATPAPLPTASAAAASPPPGRPPAAQDAAPGAPLPTPKRGRARALLALIGLVALGAALWFGADWMLSGRYVVSTDDAYVKADTAVIAAKVSGYVAEALAADNQRVTAGDPLVRIDDGDYRLAVQSAADKLATQDAAIARIGEQAGAQRATIEQARAQLAAAQADQTRAEAAFGRTQALSKSDFASRAQFDSALADKARAAAATQAAGAALAAAQQGLAVLEAQQIEARRARAELETAKARAERDMSFTTIVAPFDGVVGNKAVQPGQYVQPGARLLALVPLDTVFVEANFKETQLARIRPGQKVEIEVDALPGRAIAGEVASIAPASGAQFSLLPPDNATGNFTKIVQRVPVRITIAPELAREGVLRPGLSVVAKVMTKADAPPPSASTFSAIAAALRGRRAQ
ncbi:MAG: HlyD family secretion protein [Rhizobiales bacterium]|nr:HlyD family secretion protein [Hyphomicrobiales bacterium]